MPNNALKVKVKRLLHENKSLRFQLDTERKAEKKRAAESGQEVSQLKMQVRWLETMESHAATSQIRQRKIPSAL